MRKGSVGGAGKRVSIFWPWLQNGRNLTLSFYATRDTCPDGTRKKKEKEKGPNKKRTRYMLHQRRELHLSFIFVFFSIRETFAASVYEGIPDLWKMYYRFVYYCYPGFAGVCVLGKIVIIEEINCFQC